MIDLKLGSTSEPKTNWTEEQLSVINSESDAILVEALAGSGKSSTLMGLAHKYDNGLYLAFNKNIVTDIVSKLPEGWVCSTFNAFGLGLIRQNQKYAKVNFGKYNRRSRREASQLAQSHMNLNGGSSIDSWIKTCERYRMDTELIDDAKYILREGRMETGVISGGDMLQYPILNGWQSNVFDIVLIDEAQDCTPQQIKFITKCVPNEKIVFCGDRNQSIYYFMGSEPKVFDKVIEKYNPEVLPLKQSFRCPEAIIKEANKYVPEIWSNIKGGSVNTVVKLPVEEYPEDCFILCRVNAGLVEVANEMIQKKIRFSIGGNFVKLVKREVNAAVAGCDSVEEAIEKSKKRLNHAMSVYKKNGWSTTSLESRYETIRVVFDNYTSFLEIRDFVGKLEAHTTGSSKRRLLTGHACKGLENENVFILNQGICHHFRSKAKSDAEKAEELNILYVMITRSLNNLTFVG